MTRKKTFLDKAYEVTGERGISKLYAEWSDSYEAEVGAQGYETPRRVAAALAEQGDLSAPVLDYGCGTGLSGLALRAAGFSVIDGADPSAEMRSHAEAKGLYRKVIAIDLDRPIPIARGAYRQIAAIGVIGAGAAPARLFDDLLGLLAPGGLFAFSYNEHTLDNPDYTGRLSAALDSRKAVTISEAYGDHLTGLGSKSMVYVLRRL